MGNGTFMCGVTSSGKSCLGSCDNGYSGNIAAVCAYGVYTVSGTCEPGTTSLCDGAPCLTYICCMLSACVPAQSCTAVAKHFCRTAESLTESHSVEVLRSTAPLQQSVHRGISFWDVFALLVSNTHRASA